MNIKLSGRYKSLVDLECNLDKFAVITGKNGSGKTQFLDLINDSYPFKGGVRKKGTNDYLKNVILELNPIPSRVQYGEFSIAKNESLGGEKISELQVRGIRGLRGLSSEVRTLVEELVENGLNFQQISRSTELLKYLSGGETPENQHRLRQIGRTINSSGGYPDEYVFASVAHWLVLHKNTITAGLQLAEFSGKPFSQLEDNDFLSNPISESIYLGESTRFVNLEIIFYAYAKKWLYNSVSYLGKLEGETNSSISPKEFVEKFPPPWKTINNLLENIGFKIRVCEVDLYKFRPEATFKFYFFDVKSELQIEITDFSSGEQIIIGLIAQLFLNDNYGEHLAFPELILLDEPDAYLHPEMTSLLLKVLYETFVCKLDIQVIVTTHSPSTVALSPEDSIYVLANSPKSKLEKTNKDQALSILTENLPLLSIDYRNHKQIFTESPTDQRYYQNIFNKIKASHHVDHNLYFISSDYGKSNCENVIRIATAIRESGNKTVYGVIDWDAKNAPEANVLVHGINERYSIENFLFDPNYIVTLFAEQNLANNVRELGYDETTNIYDLKNESKDKLQKSIDWVIEKLNRKFQAITTNNPRTVRYANGIELNIPTSYLTHNGHDLEAKLRQVFPSLQKFQTSNELCIKMADLAARCYPFVPEETFKLINDLAGAK